MKKYIFYAISILGIVSITSIVTVIGYNNIQENMKIVESNAMVKNEASETLNDNLILELQEKIKSNNEEIAKLNNKINELENKSETKVINTQVISMDNSKVEKLDKELKQTNTQLLNTINEKNVTKQKLKEMSDKRVEIQNQLQKIDKDWELWWDLDKKIFPKENELGKIKNNLKYNKNSMSEEEIQVAEETIEILSKEIVDLYTYKDEEKNRLIAEQNEKENELMQLIIEMAEFN